METKHPAFWMGHTFSVVTGAAFVISAILNALTFWLTWRLNYFLIASPADVIMSGFIMVAAVAVVAGFLAMIWWVGARIRRSFENERARREKEEAEENAVIDDYVRVTGDRLRRSGIPEEEVETLMEGQRMNRRQMLQERQRETRTNAVARFAILLTAGFALSTNTVGIVEKLFDDGVSVRSVDRMWWYETGLKTASTYRHFGGLCADAPVAWLGSSAAILECRDGVRVIHNLDDLVTVRRYER